MFQVYFSFNIFRDLNNFLTFQDFKGIFRLIIILIWVESRDFKQKYVGATDPKFGGPNFTTLANQSPVF